MQKLNIQDIYQYIEDNIGSFHTSRLEGLSKLKLDKVLKKKNPYLFRAKNILTADELVKGIMDAFISSNEETIFGNWLEGLAIFVNEKVYGGRKTTTKGVDLEFDKDGTRYIVAIKSGPNWGNSSQIDKMEADFLTAMRVLRTSGAKIPVVAVNGCCYGQDNNPDKKSYYKYCGQQFWEFISGEANLYNEIIEPLGYKAQERNDEFHESFSAKLNIFTGEFIKKFCRSNGTIDWEKLLVFNSGVK